MFAQFAIDHINPLYVYIKVEGGMDMASARRDAVTVLIGEFGQPTHSPARIKGDGEMISNLPAAAWEAKGAKGWAWIGRR